MNKNMTKKVSAELPDDLAKIWDEFRLSHFYVSDPEMLREVIRQFFINLKKN
jgi:metal-responsive CopG/Arc/MetJ family transcriptional regulator